MIVLAWSHNVVGQNGLFELCKYNCNYCTFCSHCYWQGAQVVSDTASFAYTGNQLSLQRERDVMRCKWDASAGSPMGAVVITTCDAWAANDEKAAVGLTLCAQHNGYASWSTVAVMNDGVSALAKVARLQCMQWESLPCNAQAARLQARSGDLRGFSTLCYRQFTLSVSLNFMLCSAVWLRLLAFVLLVVIFLGVLIYFSTGFRFHPGWRWNFSIVTTNSCHYYVTTLRFSGN